MEIRGRRALVTGGARRLGKAIALGLADAGARVAIHYHSSADEADGVAKTCGGPALQADLSDAVACGDLVERAAAALGGIDILVNNAAVYPRGPLADIDADSWDAVQALNLRAPVLLAKDAGLRMKRAGQGVIINVTDWGAARPHTEYLAYAAAKAGLISATMGLARALAPEVRVNSVAPGAILLPEGASPEYDSRVRAATPLGRWGGAESVVSTILFLIGNDFITGGNYLVDGGRSVR